MRDWPAEKIERWPLDRLMPSARNARLHSEDQIAAIARSIERFGWTMPVLIDEKGELIAGHGRVLAAQRLGVTGDVPTIVAHGWTDDEKRAYRIADNQIAATSSWDKGSLRIELAELLGDGFDLSTLGFDDADLQKLMAEPDA